MSVLLYVASTNPGKLRDFTVAAGSYAGNVEVLPLPGMVDIAPPVEDGATFEENARSKAEEYSRHAMGRIVLADDSGLEVDALQGAPGVHSARYATDAGFDPAPRESNIDTRNNLLLLKNLTGVMKDRRIARYRCILAAARDGKCIAVGQGTVEGVILDTPRGRGGFGYDPLFYLPEFNRTMAEIDLELKNRISHRGHALRAILPQILRMASSTLTG
ncbi:MAG: non-canonical purine NTP pyrophosphatase [Acidobacteriaceae bacterium]